MPSTSNITQGIKAIKVSRLDAQGNDNSISLQELKVLRVDLGGNTVFQFDVLSIAEYPSYYLFYVAPVDFDPINIGYFTGATAVQAGLLSNGVYTLTPGSNTGRVSNYSVPSSISGSYVANTGQFTPYIPQTVTVEIRYQASQSVLTTNDNFRVELTGSSGVQTLPWVNTSIFENAPGSWNPVTQSIQWTPANPSSSIGIRFNADGLNAQTVAINIGGVKVYYNQPDFYQDKLNIPDLTFEASASSTVSVVAGNTGQITGFIETTSNPYWNAFNDQFDSPINDFYKINYTASIQARYTSSSPGAGNAVMNFSLVGNNGTIGSTTQTLAMGTSWSTYSFSGSFAPYGTGDALTMEIAETGLTRDFQYRNVYWEFDNIFTAHIEGNLAVLEPYSSENFNNSDYNALLNNSEEDRINDFFMDVDYSTNARIPVNYQAIMSGSAERARVQYSNYTTTGWTNARYTGCENTSPDWNLSGSGTYTPAVSSLGNYFAYFDQVGGSNYELFNKANFRIRYLIDPSGSIFAADISSSYYPNLLDSFNENNPVNVVFRTTDGNVDNLSGLKPVIKSGALARAIIFSQTGSNGSATQPSMSFNGGLNGSVPDYRANVNISPITSSIDPSSFQILNFSSIVGGSTNTGSAALVDLTSDYLEVTASTSETFISPRANLSFRYFDEIRGRGGQVSLEIQKSTDLGSSWNQYQIVQQPIQSSAQFQNIAILGTLEPPVEDTRYRFRFAVSASYGTEIDINSGSAYFFQNVSPISTASLASNYWTVDSTNRAIITGSQFTSTIYGLTQDTISGSGYDDPYLPFTVQVGDEIRFQASENQVYQVINVNEPGNNSLDKLILTLDKPISTGTTQGNLNNFLLRRFNPNASYVIVDAKKDGSTGGGTGFLIPKYPQNEIKTNFDAIIKILTEKGIL